MSKRRKNLKAKNMGNGSGAYNVHSGRGAFVNPHNQYRPMETPQKRIPASKWTQWILAAMVGLMSLGSLVKYCTTT